MLSPHPVSGPASFPRKKSAVLFLNHLHREHYVRRCAELEEALKETADVYYLCEESPEASPAAGSLAGTAPCYTFNAEKLKERLGYGFFMESGITPGSSHIPLLKFALDFAYEFYYLVEYDVGCADWNRLFSVLEDSFCDFMANFIRPCGGTPAYEWASSLFHPEGKQHKLPVYRSFNPFFRLSRRAAFFIHEAHRNGWRGHNEVLLPTLLKAGGFLVRDMQEFFPGSTAGLYGTGRPKSFRYRPEVSAEEFDSLKTTRLLFHPVK